MLTESEIKNLAKINGYKPRQQEKHYLQSISLCALSEEPLVFKGGTYLWFFNGLPRFSEDLDFTAKEKINTKLTEKTSNFLEQYGIENEIKIVKDEDLGLSFRISAKGPLHKTERDLCYLYIEISKRENVIEKPQNYLIENNLYGLPTRIISGMNLTEVAAEKVRAIMTRNKARDAYDLWFLIKRGAAPKKELIMEKLAFYKETFSKKAFYEKLSEKEKIFMAELKQLVFNELPKFEELKKEIKKFV
ncbi:MAG: nucleotidyl transferase AbiEii/AbiGii toxin family protein [Candidatus Diapherotrites archaeon]|nr:nucleotidyl transferase AbiEii/AbiGii toxin family protein [Candidatus Diapherotrites archaeon]